MTFQEAIAGLAGLKQQIAEKGKVIMQDEIPKKTGTLAASVHYEIGVDIVEIIAGNEHVNYARYVNDGRDEVRPQKARALHWTDGGDVFSMRSKAVPANDFAARTAERINNTQFTL